MNPIANWGQRATLDYIIRFRWMHGVSPTNREIAEQMERKPIAVSTVKTRVKVLLEEGWLVKVQGGERGERCMVPTVEARLLERLNEVVLILKRAAKVDEGAREILNYVAGNVIEAATGSSGGSPLLTEREVVGP